MKKRIPLKLNTLLRFKNQNAGIVCYYVDKPIGFGGTCIVYDGYYINNEGQKKTVRIKECYPYKLQLTRMKDNSLIVEPNQYKTFEEYKQRFRTTFKISNHLFKESGLSNSISNALDIYESNNTLYVISSYVEGMTLDNYKIKSLLEATKLVKSIAITINQIHKMGYLYLDIKPENIMIFPETTELIQLFDFDSMIPMNINRDISDYHISYSKGFAPLEQKSGNLSNIGIPTDIYSIGALLFYIVFKRVPTALDCDTDTNYNFTQINNYYSDKLYKELEIFFHNTLQSYYNDRYHSMQDVINQLVEIEKYADLSKPFLHSSIIPDCEMCIGRENELERIDEWIMSDSSCLFVTGMGGIGKSTLVRKYLSSHLTKFVDILYLYCNDSICNTITDDEQLFINNCEKSKDESSDEYFRRKINVLKLMKIGVHSILVLDNFSGDMDEYLKNVIEIGWKVIVITRKDMKDSGYPVIQIHEIMDKALLYKLFIINTGKLEEKIRVEKIQRIIDLVNSHTLSVELIAKQIGKSYLTMDEALVLVENNGFSNIASEKIEILKDGQRYYEKISELIQAIYKVDSMNSNKKNILKILSVFDSPGIDIKELKHMLQLNSYDDVNELIKAGWIYLSGEMVYLHPLIQETINQMAWNDVCRQIITKLMTELFKIIKLNGKKEEYPKKLDDHNIKIKQYMEQSKFAKKRFQKMASKKGVIGEVMLNRIAESTAVDIKVNRKLLDQKLRMASTVIKNCIRDEELSEKEIFKNLIFITIINTPKDQETFILKYSEILLHNKDSVNPYAIMDLYDYTVYICCQREDFEMASNYLKAAYCFAKKRSINHLWGIYYDMLTDYYEAILDGAYDNQKLIFQKLLNASDKAIHYMSKSKNPISKSLSAKYMLGKATLLIRSCPDDVNEIHKLITKAKPLIEKYTLEYSSVRSIYYMAYAWYYTLCEPNKENVLINLAQARRINNHNGMSELDEIDYFYIPAANMMYELNNCKQAIKLLSEGIRICEQYNDMTPFIRKKEDLMSYMSEVKNKM